MKIKSILNKKIALVKSFNERSGETLFPTKLLSIRLENGLNLLFEGAKIPSHPEKQGLKFLDKALIVVNRRNKYLCEDIIICDDRIVDVGFLSKQSITGITNLISLI
jgi:hypothetical protein